MSRSALVVVVGVLCVFALGTLQSAGMVIIHQASLEFSNGTPPAGTAPWLTVTFDDGGGSGSVKMTFEATNLVGSEFVSGLYLNVVAGINPSSLVFSSPTKVGSFQSPTISRGTDQYKADGGGYFDILLSFSTSGGSTSGFTGGDAVTYTISGLPSLTAASFNTVATPNSTPGTHYMAAHVQGIGEYGDFSGWVTTPEPISLSLLSLGCVMVMRRRVR